jgi:hypothetical protein
MVAGSSGLGSGDGEFPVAEADPGSPISPEAAFRDMREAHAQGGGRAATIGRNHAEAAPGVAVLAAVAVNR